MAVLLVVLLVLTIAGVAGTIAAVRSDGSGPRPARGDRFVSPRRWL
jgi:hypothetical protein